MSHNYYRSHNSIQHVQYASTPCFPLKKRLLHPSSFHRLAGAAGASVDGCRPQRRGMSASMRALWCGTVDGWNGRCIENCRGLKVDWFLCHHCHLKKSWLPTIFICSTLYVYHLPTLNTHYLNMPYIAIILCLWIFDKSVQCYLFPHA